MNCPKCGGDMWDERRGKFWGDGKFKSGKNKPTHKCKNKECDGVAWEKANGVPVPTHAPSKPIAAQEPDHRPNPNAKEVPGAIEDSAYADSLVSDRTETHWERMARQYKECAAVAMAAWGNDTQADALVAAAATLFIQRSQKGV